MESASSSGEILTELIADDTPCSSAWFLDGPIELLNLCKQNVN